jgi:hypothetical protein
MGQIAVSEMPVLVARCYKRFLEYFLWKPFAFVTKTAQAANIAVCGLAVLLFGMLTVQRKLYKDILSYILLVIVCLFVPLAAAFIYFMAPEVDYSMLMLYAYVLIYVLVLSLLEKCIRDWKKLGKDKKWQCNLAQTIVIFTVVVMFVSCYTDYLLTNKAYLRTDIATQRVAAYFNRVIEMAESSEGFEKDDKITILGEFYYKDNPSSVELDIFDSEDLRELSGVALENGLITSGVRDNFIRTYIGYETARLSDSRKEEIMDTDEYKNMPVYPENGCVQKINGIWVVKMCN